MASKITLNWVDVNVVEDGYKIYKSNNPIDMKNLPTPTALTKDTETWEDTDVLYGETYHYVVSAYNDQDESFSDPRSVTLIEKTYTYSKDENMIRILDTASGQEIGNILNVFSNTAQVDNDARGNNLKVLTDGTIYIQNTLFMSAFNSNNERLFEVNLQSSSANTIKPARDFMVLPNKKIIIIGNVYNNDRGSSIAYLNTDGSHIANIDNIFSYNTNSQPNYYMSKILNVSLDNYDKIWIHGMNPSFHGVFSYITINADDTITRRTDTSGFLGTQDTYSLPVVMEEDRLLIAFQRSTSISLGSIRAWEKSPFQRYDVKYTKDLPFSPHDYDFNKRNRRIYGLSSDGRLMSINYLTGDVITEFPIPDVTKGHKMSINNYDEIIVATDKGTKCIDADLTTVKWTFNEQTGEPICVASQGGQLLHRNGIEMVQTGTTGATGT